MTPIPAPADSTVSRIWQHWQNKEVRHHRKHLGASLIGRPCEREIWFSFRWAKKPDFSGRMLKLFQRGTLEEAIFAADLKGIGVDFMPLDPDTGEQWSFSEFGGHFKANLDGVGYGLIEAPTAWHTFEFKTHNDDSFKKLVKEGVKIAKPEHYAQMQTGMGMSGIERACYMAVNKNTDDIHMERIKFDKKDWTDIKNKANSIIFCMGAPDKINESPAWFQCKMCQFSDICHNTGGIAETNCRTCKHSSPLTEGGWGCNLNETVIDSDCKPCAKHEFLPDMMSEVLQDALKMFDGKIEKVERK